MPLFGMARVVSVVSMEYFGTKRWGDMAGLHDSSLPYLADRTQLQNYSEPLSGLNTVTCWIACGQGLPLHLAPGTFQPSAI
jgi:hypothetical protein